MTWGAALYMARKTLQLIRRLVNRSFSLVGSIVDHGSALAMGIGFRWERFALLYQQRPFILYVIIYRTHTSRERGCAIYARRDITIDFGTDAQDGTDETSIRCT